MVLIEDGKCFTSSTALCRVTRYLRRPWRWLRIAIVIPAPLRDVIYQWIADHRYKWFGRLDRCRVATAELAGRFL
jgi:predicted DCC family thiol-disulfide oxidoreductase YuxK